LLKILIVDDSRFQRRLLSELLENDGHETIEASGGKEAIDLLADLMPDIILLDIVMPGMDGIETCKRLREREYLKAVPIVVFTSLDSDKDIVRAIEAGADDYIAKSSDPKVILARLRANLRTKIFYNEMDRIKRDQSSIMDIMLKMSSMRNTSEVLQILTDSVSIQVGGRASVMLLDEGLSHATIIASSDRMPEGEKEIDLEKYPEIRHSLSSREVLVINDVEHEPVVREVAETLKELNVSSIIVIPLLFHDEILGALFMRGQGEKKEFNEDDIRLCRIMAGAAGNAIKDTSLLSELGETNRMLKEAHGEKAEFFAITAHDLTTPLSIIQTCNEMLKAGIYGSVSESQAEMIQTAIDSCDIMARFINDMRQIAKVEHGKLELNLTDNHIPTFLASICDHMQLLALKEGINLDTADDLPDIDWPFDAERIGQVLTNLIENSIKYNKEGCRITVGAEMTDEGCSLFVEDSGKGLPEGKHGSVFNIFFRLKSDKNTPGLGMGLYICKKFVEAHNGRIWLEGGSNNGNNRFTFFLPPGGKERRSSGD